MRWERSRTSSRTNGWKSRSAGGAWSAGVGEAVLARCRLSEGKSAFEIADDLGFAALLDADIATNAGLYRRHALTAAATAETDLLRLPAVGVSLDTFLDRLEIESSTNPELALIEECVHDQMHPARADIDRIGHALMRGDRNVHERLIRPTLNPAERHVIADVIEKAPASQQLAELLIDAFMRAEYFEHIDDTLTRSFVRCESPKQRQFADILKQAAAAHPDLPRQVRASFLDAIADSRTERKTQAIYILDGQGGRPKRLAKQEWVRMCERRGMLPALAGQTVWIAEVKGAGAKPGHPRQIDTLNIFEVTFDTDGEPTLFCQPALWMYPGDPATLRVADAEVLADRLKLMGEERNRVRERITTLSDHAGERRAMTAMATMFMPIG